MARAAELHTVPGRLIDDAAAALGPWAVRLTSGGAATSGGGWPTSRTTGGRRVTGSCAS